MLIRGVKNYLRDKIWIFLKAKWKLRSGIFVRIENDSDWYVFNEIFTNKEYDPAFKFFFSSPSSNPLILDLGANVGYFTLRIADELIMAGYENYTIISVEGAPSNYQVLQNRLKQPLIENKIKCFFGLAGYKTGVSKVIHSSQHYGHFSGTDNSGAKTEEVKYIDIEELIAGDARQIELLKCDIEGSEEIFIKEYSALIKRVNSAVFEFHAGECDVNNCRQMLKDLGLISKGVIRQETQYKTTVEIFSRS